LPSARRSGLLEAIDVLQHVDGLAFVHFDESDVVRHHLVQRIVRAYDEHKARIAEQQLLLPTEVKGADVASANGKPTPNSNGKPAAGNGQKLASAEAQE